CIKTVGTCAHGLDSW
nr:immunoglobulin heavy chain junction region [Macaca mulatta]